MKQRAIWIVVLGLMLAGVSVAQTKTSGTINCGKPDPAYSIEVGDKTGHAVGLVKVPCTWSKAMQIEGVETKDGYDVAMSDGAGKFRVSGYHVSNMANGDKIFVRFAGTDTYTKDGKPDSSVGTWSYTGGTGKLKGITGKGTYKGKADASGAMVTDVEGDYTLPAKK